MGEHFSSSLVLGPFQNKLNTAAREADQEDSLVYERRLIALLLSVHDMKILCQAPELWLSMMSCTWPFISLVENIDHPCWIAKHEMYGSGSLGAGSVVGDTRWAGVYGIDADLIAKSHCSVEFIHSDHIQVQVPCLCCCLEIFREIAAVLKFS